MLLYFTSSKLTWRDVQHIIVNAAQVTSPVDEGWVNNGAGFHFNHKFGFGRLDASKMVSLAKNWKNVARQRKCLGPSSSSPQYGKRSLSSFHLLFGQDCFPLLLAFMVLPASSHPFLFCHIPTYHILSFILSHSVCT